MLLPEIIFQAVFIHLARSSIRAHPPRLVARAVRVAVFERVEEEFERVAADPAYACAEGKTDGADDYEG